MFLTFPRPWFYCPAIVFSLASSRLPSSLHTVRLALLAGTFPTLCLQVPTTVFSLLPSYWFSVTFKPVICALFASFYHSRGVMFSMRNKQYMCFFCHTCPLCSTGRQTNGQCHMDKRTHGLTDGQTNFR